MTQQFKLPPLPEGVKDSWDKRIGEAMQDYARQAIEADRQARGNAVAPAISSDPVAWISDSPTKGNGKRLFWTKTDAWRWSSNVKPLYTAQQPTEPVAWYTDDHLTDKSATTWDRTVAARWRDKGWPVGELFAAPQPSTEGVCKNHPQQTPVKDIPEGYRIVPIEPTPEMMRAGCQVPLNKAARHNLVYKAMLEAAPEDQ